MPNTVFDDYIKLMENTESCALYHRWAFTACCGALLGHSVFMPFGAESIYPTQYVMLMGESAARKSSAIKAARKLLAATGYNTFAAVRTTKEKFLLDLEGRETDDGEEIEELEFYDELAAREVFIVNDEFNEFIGMKNMNFIGTLGVLWDWDPQEPYTDKVKNSRSVRITEPVVSVLGGNTPGNFALAFPPEILTQGFFSRLLLVHGERTDKRFTIPPPLDEQRRTALVNHIARVKASITGKIHVTPEAMQVMDYIYTHEKEYWFDDSRFVSYQGRRFTHLLKLTLLTAALAARKEIVADDVIYSNTVLAFTEKFMPKAIGEFGKNKNSELANKIMQLLLRSDMPVTQKNLFRAVSSDGSLREIIDCISTLEQANKIGSSKNDNGEFVFYPVREAGNKTRKYVEYDRLSPEEQEKVK